MKVIIPATEDKPSLNTHPSRLFGSAKSYIIYDTCEDTFMSIENTFFGTKNIDIASDLKDLGVGSVVTERICETCLHNLQEMEIDVWKDDGSYTIREAFQKFMLGCHLLLTDAHGLKLHPGKIVTKERRKQLKLN